MKKFLSKLFILLFAFVLVVPYFALAAKKEPVIVYLFRGEGCPHCAEAEEWFASIEEEYGDYFDLQDYEVWYNEENSELMSLVAQYMGESADGVPYIIVGDHTFSGFDTSYEEQIIGYIKEEYEKDPAERANIVPTVIQESGWGQEEDTTTRDLIVGLVLVVIVVGLVAIIIVARKED